MKCVLFVVCGGLLLCGCSNTNAQSRQAAKKTADALTGDAKNSAANNLQCKLFTLAEIQKYAGKPVKPGQNAAGASGCQWVTTDESSFLIVQVVPAEYYQTPPRSATMLADVGTKGYVAAHLLWDWNAAAIQGDNAVMVAMDGPIANEKTTVDILRETLKRRTK
jgi:hypothetical protein